MNIQVAKPLAACAVQGRRLVGPVLRVPRRRRSLYVGEISGASVKTANAAFAGGMKRCRVRGAARSNRIAKALPGLA